MEIIKLKIVCMNKSMFLSITREVIYLFLVASIYNGEISRDSDSFQVSPSCDSPQLSPSRDSYNTLSALSHACQLINIIAFYLNIKLPFHLHQW